MPSRDLVICAHQQITREWWARRDRFDLFVSQAVVREASAGDRDAVARRLSALSGLAVLELGAAGAVPESAEIDAVHIAVATVNGMEFLVTWNCAHIANAAARPRIEDVCAASRFRLPVICTPEGLMEGSP